jgi:hypothetical protein
LARAELVFLPSNVDVANETGKKEKGAQDVIESSRVVVDRPESCVIGADEGREKTCLSGSAENAAKLIDQEDVSGQRQP